MPMLGSADWLRRCAMGWLGAPMGWLDCCGS